MVKFGKRKKWEKGYSLGIAANKSDLLEQSEVDDEEGKKYAEKEKAIWKLTSALEENKGIDELVDELLNNYINIVQKESNFDDITIKLDKSTFSKKNQTGYCKGKKSKNKNNIRNNSYFSDKSVISKSVSEDNDLSVF